MLGVTVTSFWAPPFNSRHKRSFPGNKWIDSWMIWRTFWAGGVLSYPTLEWEIQWVVDTIAPRHWYPACGAWKARLSTMELGAIKWCGWQLEHCWRKMKSEPIGHLQGPMLRPMQWRWQYTLLPPLCQCSLIQHVFFLNRERDLQFSPSAVESVCLTALCGQFQPILLTKLIEITQNEHRTWTCSSNQCPGSWDTVWGHRQNPWWSEANYIYTFIHCHSWLIKDDKMGLSSDWLVPIMNSSSQWGLFQQS